MDSAREYDIVVWGATGFTGKLVAEYLASAPSAKGLKWAVGGRNRDKLGQVCEELGLSGVGILVGDAGDEAGLREVARATKVVCTTVGPYAKYGSPMVAACVAEGTHYCDLTGEVPWIRQMIDAHHDAARDRGARIVHCCGFDSIPSDLGTWMMHEAMQARGHALGKVDTYAGESKGAFSGGTIASLLGVVDAARRDPAVRRVLGNPYGLNPAGEDRGPDGPDKNGVSYEPRLGQWAAPFVMAAINTRVVRRSNAIAGYPYGKEFRYTERMSTGSGAKGLALATAIAGGLAGFVVATQVPAIRPLLERKLPSPGEGPSKHLRETGFFTVRLLAESDDGTLQLAGHVAHDRDPGYGSTSVMLAESALCLAKDDLSSPGGVLTPASAMGSTLMRRLRAAGMTFLID